MTFWFLLLHNPSDHSAVLSRMPLRLQISLKNIFLNIDRALPCGQKFLHRSRSHYWCPYGIWALKWGIAMILYLEEFKKTKGWNWTNAYTFEHRLFEAKSGQNSKIIFFPKSLPLYGLLIALGQIISQTNHMRARTCDKAPKFKSLPRALRKFPDPKFWPTFLLTLLWYLLSTITLASWHNLISKFVNCLDVALEYSK